jgi:hypothetical protein
LLSGAVGAHRGYVFDGWVIGLAIATHPTPTCAAEPGGWREDPADADRAVGGKWGLTAGGGSGSFTTPLAEPQGGAVRRLLSGAVGAHRGYVFDGWVIALAIATHPVLSLSTSFFSF